jgi:hypothetical protein
MHSFQIHRDMAACNASSYFTIAIIYTSNPVKYRDNKLDRGKQCQESTTINDILRGVGGT